MRLFLFFFTLSLSLSLEAGVSVAEIFYLKGQVKVIKNNEPHEAEKGMKLGEGDEVQTGDDSLAILNFLGTSKMKLDPNTKIKIAKHVPKNTDSENSFTRFYLKWGATVIDFLNKKKENDLEIQANRVAIAVRGTNFFVGYGDNEEEGDVYTLVNEGNVSALNFKSDDHEDIPSGKGVVVNREGKISKAQTFSWGSRLNWKMKAKEHSNSGFRGKGLIRERLKNRPGLMQKLKFRHPRPFVKSGKFSNWKNHKRENIRRNLIQSQRKRQLNETGEKSGLKKKIRNKMKKKKTSSESELKKKAF